MSYLDEVNGLKNEIKHLNERILDMESERKSMTLAHQCQITQLKDTFKEKMRSIEDWPDKLNSELSKEREKHNQEMKKLEHELNQNFRMV